MLGRGLLLNTFRDRNNFVRLRGEFKAHVVEVFQALDLIGDVFNQNRARHGEGFNQSKPPCGRLSPDMRVNHHRSFVWLVSWRDLKDLFQHILPHPFCNNCNRMRCMGMFVNTLVCAFVFSFFVASSLDNRGAL